VRQRIGEFHLSTGRHNGVPRRYHDRHRDVDIADPFVRGELPDSGDCSRHRCHAGQTHFSVDVCAARGIKVVQIAKAKCVGGSMRRRGFTRAVTEKAGEIDETMRSAVDLRKLRNGTESEPTDPVWLSVPQLLCDKASHHRMSEPLGR
jgi:hypothetical protein